MNGPGEHAPPLSAPRPAGPAAVPTVAADLRCLFCSYNLRGLPAEGGCPECGGSIAVSQRGLGLEHADPAHRRRLARGLGLAFTGVLLTVGAVMFKIVWDAVRGGFGGEMLSWLLFLTPQAVLLRGYWLYADPDLGIGPGSSVRSRRVLRWATLTHAAGLAASVPAGILAAVGPGPVPDAAGVILSFISLGVTLSLVVQFFSMMHYSRWTARRLPASKWPARIRRYTWLLPVLILLPFGLAYAMAWVVFNDAAEWFVYALGLLMIACFLAPPVLYARMLCALKRRIRALDRPALPEHASGGEASIARRSAGPADEPSPPAAGIAARTDGGGGR